MTGVLPVLAGMHSDAIPRWLVALSIFSELQRMC
jgi:hypothetical protein